MRVLSSFSSAARNCTVSFLVLVLVGCAHLFEDTMKSWVGAPLKEFQDQYHDSRLVSKNGPDANGQSHYAYDVYGHDRCIVHWDVDAGGVIRGWTHEGPYCKSTWP